MFDVLPASSSPQAKRTKWLTTSIIIHALVVMLTVMATRGALEATKVAKAEEPFAAQSYHLRAESLVILPKVGVWISQR
jgi:hypothetical protein